MRTAHPGLRFPIVPIFVLLAAIASAGGAPRAAARGAEDAERPALAGITWYDGSSWIAVDLHQGIIEGPGEADSPKARFQSRLGGPKSFFVLGGEESDLPITNARPRFRVETDEATARRAQIAPLEGKDGNRVTPIETSKGIAVFTRAIDLEASEVRDGIWELKPKKSLQPGEYVLAITGAEPVAAFRIVARGY